jgi:hypothetical protein
MKRNVSLFIDSEFDSSLKKPFLSLQIAVKEKGVLISSLFLLTEEKYTENRSVIKEVLDRKKKNTDIIISKNEDNVYEDVENYLLKLLSVKENIHFDLLNKFD